MKIQALSHAGLRIAAGGKELICDPWLLGSCYWRSWWNYPPVPRALVDSLKPDFIYITHIHWDHFQGPSLKVFPKETMIILPYDRYDRMRRDLNSLGFHNIVELRNGERRELAPGFAIRSYHINPTITDSAVVIEADGHVILNANDAKLAGLPLRQLLAKYPKIDFCFRSHSSANGRVCIKVTDEPDVVVDDNDHYLRAFSLFMQQVNPRYAVPFASNSCLLNDDVFHLNHLVQTPHIAKEYFDRFAAETGLKTKLQIMLPGDSWDSETGFDLTTEDWFGNRQERLIEYRDRVRPTLDRQAKIEARVKAPRKAVVDYFTALARNTPGWLAGSLRQEPVLIISRSEAETIGFAVSMSDKSVTVVEAADFNKYDIQADFPALILLQSVRMNMFGHAFISKRAQYRASRRNLGALQRFIFLLDLAECELLPMRTLLQWRTVRALLPRWREGLLYLQVLLKMRSGKSLPDIEEELLAA